MATHRLGKEDQMPIVAHVMRAYLAGTETFIHNQISSLQRHHAIVLCHHLRPNSDYSYEEGATASDVLPKTVARFDRLAYRATRTTLPPASAALASYASARNAQLVHYHFVTDARFFLGIKTKAGLPALVSAYGYDVSSFPAAWLGVGRRYLNAVFNRVECILAMSDDMKSDLVSLGCSEDRIRVHYHGIDAQRFRCPERKYFKEGPLTILSCGRFVPKKGHLVLLRALREVDPTGRRFRVILVGDGPLRSEIENSIAAYGLERVVTLVGEIPHRSAELLAHYRRADIFTLASMTVDGEKEGIPGTVVEAMAAGLPVVSTRHAGIPSVIESDHHGLLVPEGDVDALAQALDRLLGNATLRERLGRAAAERASRELDLRTRTNVLELIYDDLITR
jgi:colanic acid/amylovoran biosynthesis glycosyltransferase